MNAIELLLLDLVQIAEAPLYSAYRWLDNRLARRLPIRSFLELVEGLVTRDVVRLWSTDAPSGDRTELFSVPAGLSQQYEQLDDLDGSYDPFGLSLILGAAVPPDITRAPQWSLELDIRNGSFQLRSPESVAGTIFLDVASVLADLTFIDMGRQHLDNGDVIISGRVVPQTA